MGSGSIKRIVFTGDFLRTNAGEDNQSTNVIWLESILRDKLQVLTGLTSSIVMPIPATAWEAIGRAPSLQNWSETFWSSSNDQLCHYIAEIFSGALVVALELPPVLESALDRSGIPWIDVGVSPLRFLPDFALSFRFSHALYTPWSFDISAEYIARCVAHLRRFYSGESITGSVFFAQTDIDRSLIGNAGLVDVQAMLAGVDTPEWVKPHPLAPKSAVVEYLCQRGAKLLEANTYAALTSDISVLTISSSVAAEARCFNIKTTVLHPEVIARNASGITTLNGYRSSAFWRHALQLLPLTDTDFDEPFEQNTLRRQLHSFGLDPRVYEGSVISLT